MWVYRCEEGVGPSQVSGEQGRGTAFGEITEAGGLRSRSERDSWVPSSPSPRPQAGWGRGVGRSPPPLPQAPIRLAGLRQGKVKGSHA